MLNRFKCQGFSRRGNDFYAAMSNFSCYFSSFICLLFGPLGLNSSFVFYCWEKAIGESAAPPPSAAPTGGAEIGVNRTRTCDLALPGLDGQSKRPRFQCRKEVATWMWLIRALQEQMPEVPKGPQRGVASLVTFLPPRK